jgi:hypothetical protein
MPPLVPHIFIDGVEHKKCSGCCYKPCDINRPDCAFSPGKGRWDNLAGLCKDCMKKSRAKSRDKKIHPENYIKPPKTHKKCNGPCGEEKELKDFYTIGAVCKVCKNEKEKQEYPKIKDKKQAKSRESYLEKRKDRGWVEARNATEREGYKRRREDPEYIKSHNAKIRAHYTIPTNRERKNENQNRTRAERVKIPGYSENRNKQIRNRYRRKMESDDHHWKITRNLRCRLWQVCQRQNAQKQPTMELVNGSWEELKEYIELQFSEGMNWGNYGSGWHLDHIIPCNAFDFTIELDQRICFWYRNLQPMWGLENIRKSDKYKEEDKLKLINEYINSF